MRQALVYVNKTPAGMLMQADAGEYTFHYFDDYVGPPVSLTMPTQQRDYHFRQFPAFFEGLLPEGMALEALLRKFKLDRDDYFGQLLQVGADVVGAVSVKEKS